MAERLTSGTIELNRVVITGMGMVNAVGNSVASAWAAALDGVPGVAEIVGMETDDLAVKIAAQVKEFDPSTVLERKEVRRLDPFLHYAVAAAQEAVDDSGLKIGPEISDRVGVLIGSGIGGLRSIQENAAILATRGPRRVSALFIPQMVANMASGVVSMRFGARGPNSCVVTACTTGTHSIGEAFRLLQRGDAEAMIAGGAEAPIERLGLAGFASMKALSTRNDSPATASRPFDKERDGFVIGEGAGVVVLETLAGALARGARIHGEIVGYGMSGDAHHMTAPPDDGGGAQLSMRRSIEDAGLGLDAVDYINAHGTSTPVNDRTESRAIRAVFGEHADRIPVSSTKSMTGHALGAAGGIEAIFTTLAVRDGRLPPTINYETPDPDCDLDYVPNTARSARVRVGLSNSFGFGGTNATLAIARYDAPAD
jgi:3-oxoacyl-[acyl-carrier-protein] synthase II